MPNAPGIYRERLASGSDQYAKTPSGYGALIGRFLMGRHDRFTLTVSWEDFKKRFGSSPLTGYEADWWSAKSFFEASKGTRGTTGRLYVRNVCHYTDPADTDTAACSFAANATLATLKLPLAPASRGSWPAADEENLIVRVQDASNGRSGYKDIIVLLNGDEVVAYRNGNWTTTDPQCFRNLIPTDGDGYIKPGEWTGDGLEPANGDYAFTGGSTGLSGLAATDFIGAASEDDEGNTGFYGLQNYLSINAQRPTFVLIPGGLDFSETLYPLLVAQCEELCLDIYYPPPDVSNSSTLADWVIGQGSYTESKQKQWGTARSLGPWIHPRDCADLTLYIPPNFADAGRKCRIDDSYHIAESHAGVDKGKGDLSDLFDRARFTTNADDSARLNPLNMNLIRTDKGMIIWGNRGFAIDQDYVDWPNRRISTILLAGAEAQSDWMVFGFNDEGFENSPGVRDRGRRALIQFMRLYAADGVFASKELGVGYDCFDITIDPEDVLSKICRLKMAVKFRGFAEFVYLYFQGSRTGISSSRTEI